MISIEIDGRQKEIQLECSCDGAIALQDDIDIRYPLTKKNLELLRDAMKREIIYLYQYLEEKAHDLM